MNNYRRIAVAVDFSDQSLKALERAKNVALTNKATLLLVNVVDTKSFGSVAAYDLKYAEKLKQQSEEKIYELKSRLQAEGVPTIETMIEEGSPKQVLTGLTNVDLIICGATGLNKLEKMVIGSVAERIVRYSPYDVLIVR
ncbi:universal stress protein [Lysinibacillus yapensis]|uniref:Universal stress protein n=1 Tax=Ureibacillus yapensis TaxID=2304605 RepID=A0A396SJD3_9BACL|nr:universal stress protein [Lysinibacillus yapensis]